jgi:hypothetical protein
VSSVAASVLVILLARRGKETMKRVWGEEWSVAMGGKELLFLCAVGNMETAMEHVSACNARFRTHTLQLFSSLQQ